MQPGRRARGALSRVPRRIRGMLRSAYGNAEMLLWHRMARRSRFQFGDVQHRVRLRGLDQGELARASRSWSRKEATLEHLEHLEEMKPPQRETAPVSQFPT